MIDYQWITRDEIRPGAFRIESADYHGGAGVSSSTLKDIYKTSPMHAMYERGDTPAMAFGRAFHSYILEPETFDEFYKLGPTKTRTSKAWVEMEKENPGVELISEDDLVLLQELAAKMETSEYWNKIKPFDREVAFFTTDEKTGVLKKCKCDMIGDRIVDWKTTVSAAPGEFIRAAVGDLYMYHVSAAYYVDIVKEHTGTELPFVWAAIEKKPPYAIAYYRVPQLAIERGRNIYRSALDKYAECVEKQEFPGFPDYEVEPDLPGWFR